MGRARRRSRGAGDREHGHRAGVPDRARRRAAEPRSRTRCASSRGGPSDRAPAHRMAQRRPEAGDRGRQRRVRRWRACTSSPTPTSSSRRATRPSSTRTCRSARSTAYEAIALVRKSPMEAMMRMALIGRHERMTAQRGGPARDRSARSSTPERLREAAQALAEKIAETVRRPWPNQAGALGSVGAGPHRRWQGRRRRARRHVGSPGPGRRPVAVRREAGAELAATVLTERGRSGSLNDRAGSGRQVDRPTRWCRIVCR